MDPRAMDPELAELLAAWFGGAVADDRREVLLARLRADAAFRAAFAAEARLFGMLKVVRSGPPRWLRLDDVIGWSAEEPPPAGRFEDEVVARIHDLPPHTGPRGRRSLWAAVAIALLLAVALVGISLREARTAGTLSEAIALVARLTGPGWDGTGPAEGDVFGAGPLVLTGGTATLAFFNGVTVHLEGPATLDVQSANRVVCRRGKVRIDVPAEAPGFTAAAADALVVNPLAEFAMTAIGGVSRVAVFGGTAEVSVLGREGQTLRSESLTGGRAVRIDPGAGRAVSDAGEAGDFAGPIPRIAPQLLLAPDYARAVLADRPAAYWRFEAAPGGLSPNEVHPGPPLWLIGQAAVADDPAGGNHVLALPHPTEEEQHGAVSGKPWTPTGRDFTVECWAMPRSVRQAVAVGLVADVEASLLERHGVLLELTGTPAAPLWGPHRTVRALNRVPVGKGRGVNLYSSAQYLPYLWYHLVARQAGDRFELYLNGELTGLGAAGSDATLPGCRVLVGALHAARDGTACFHRPFVGRIDELAVYDHALPPDAIARHHQLGRGAGPQ